MLGPMLAVALAASLAALVAAGGSLPPPGPDAGIGIPDEPGAVVLPGDEPTVQAVAADLDEDGAPELVRLVGMGGDALAVEVWREGEGSWELAAPPMRLVPGATARPGVLDARRPVRLLVRRVAGHPRVTLLRQTDGAAPEDPAACCLTLDDVVLAAGAVELVRVVDAGSVADSVHVIDLDGDGTDELFAAYFLAPINVASTATEGRVFRWADGRFAPPTTTELPVGSGSTPYVLGDSDGAPGDEMAVISSSARSTLFRVSLGPDDGLVVEDSGLIADDALAVPLGARDRGLAVRGPSVGLAILRWPRGQPAGAPIAALAIETDNLIGVVEIGGTSRLLAHRTDPDALDVLALPSLEPLPGGAVEPSRAAAALRGGPATPYVGRVPGGWRHGDPAAIVDGRLLPGPAADAPAAPIGALAAGQPIGLVGSQRSWLAIHQGMPRRSAIDPSGGRLDPPAPHPAAAVTIAPLAGVGRPEADGGAYEPAILGGVPLRDGVIGVSRGGLVAEVRAPPGSRVYLPEPDRTAAPLVRAVGPDGALDVVLPPPAGAGADGSGTVTMTVATPSGHAYVSSWTVRLVETPPGLSAGTATPIGSSRVTVAGRTAPHAQVEVAGTAVAVDVNGRFATSVHLPPWPTSVTVVARDAIGNETILVVSGVGIVDYRSLPWVPIVLILSGGMAVALIMRAPRPRSEPGRAGDDAGFEEVDPAERL